MNCGTIERLLLEQAAELTPRARRRVHEHVAECRHCQAYRDDLDRLRFAAAALLPATEPAPAVMRRIMNAAAARPAGRALWQPAVGWRALAAAAALVLLAGLAALVATRPAPPPTQTAGYRHLAEPAGILAALMDREAETTEPVQTTLGQADIHSLARQLLLLEGLTVEIPGEDGEAEITDVERQPTTLQWRSNPEVPSAECA